MLGRTVPGLSRQAVGGAADSSVPRWQGPLLGAERSLILLLPEREDVVGK